MLNKVFSLIIRNLLAGSILHVGMLCTCFESSLQATDNKQASYIHLKYLAPAALKIYCGITFSHKDHYITARKFTYRQNTTCGGNLWSLQCRNKSLYC